MRTTVVCLAISLAGALSTACTRIDAGHVGLKVNMTGSEKGVSDVTEVSGWVFYLPGSTQVVEFPSFTQTKDYDAFDVRTRDGASFHVDPTLNYFPDPGHIPQIYRQYRKDLPTLENTLLRNMVFDAYRIVANSFTSDSLVAQRAKFETMVETELKKSLTEDGFVFERLTSNVVPPRSLQAAIDAKNEAVQTAMRMRNQVETERAKAQIRITQANGAAEARLIEARAESEANRMRQLTLTPLLIEQMKIQKWNGVLPQYGTSPYFIKN